MCHTAIRRDTGFAAVEGWPLELSDLASVRSFVDRFEKDDDDLDMLVENAGLLTRDFALTKEGFEST